MAHNINYANGKHSFFSRKEIAWHRLGQVVPDALTSEQAIKEAGLDYTVHKVPIYADFRELPVDSSNPRHTIRGAEISTNFATVREDTRDVLGMVGNRYEVVQNSQAFDFADTIVGSKEAIFETAGALGAGEQIFVTAKLPSIIRIAETDDIIEEYFLFTSSHDGSKPIIAGFTPIRVVCNNTLNMALKGLKNKVVLRHTKSVHEKLEMARELMGLSKAYSLEFGNVINQLAKIQVSETKVQEVIKANIFTPAELKTIEVDGVFSDELSSRKKNLYSDMIYYVDSGVGQELHRGTALWLYNGVSSYYNNGKKYSSDEDRFKQLIDGTAYKNTQEVFNLVTELI